MTSQPVKIAAQGVDVHYGDSHAIRDVNIDIADKTVTAFIGPPGCGKSTFLRFLNRTNDTIAAARVTGDIPIAHFLLYPTAATPQPPRANIRMTPQH